MQFNSYEFILLFLPILIALYFVANRVKTVCGKFVIVIASIVFYAMGRWNMLLFLGISIVLNYIATFLIKRFAIKNKILIAIPMIINVAILLYFKYLNFAILNINHFCGKSYPLRDIILPLGISFYTFQQIAYVVAAQKKELKSTNLLDYLVYILYFPKLVMGPLVDPVDFIDQINDETRKRIDFTNLATGIKIFSLGLIKKVLLADTFSKAVSWSYSNLDIATSMDCILLMLFYTFEIYFDFSGYSDMAVGISSMINIELPMNFDSPYKAISIRDFWKRWHISLTKFLTKYIYIPLGGSRKGKIFTIINTLFVFLVSGLWHGANWTFILWGAIHGIISLFDRGFNKIEEKIFMPIRWMCNFALVSVLWLLFSAESVEQWMMILKKILLMQNTSISDGIIDIFKISESQFIYHVFKLNFLPENMRGFNMIVFILSASIICFVPDNNYKNKDKLGVFSMIMASLVFVWGVLCLGMESTFVYYGF